MALLGGIAGDIIGAPYEWFRIKHKGFPLFSEMSMFTDDSVLTVAVASALLEGRDYGEVIREFGNRYPNRGYGGFFSQWLATPGMGPYNSFGNGAAMRVGPVGFAVASEQEAFDEAKKSAECTHDHPEGVKGAQATALCVYLARGGTPKDEIRDRIERTFGYDLTRTLDDIRPTYGFNETCQATVPEAIQCFLEGHDFEDTVRNAISLGGDSDTLACISGSIADAYYGVPQSIRERIERYLPDEFLDIIAEFEERYPRGTPPPSN
jgi:ADP-ribosylglycohydrolase